MTAVDSSTEEKVWAVRALCEQGRWSDVLAFAQKWHAENPAGHKALYYMGLGFSGTRQFALAESAYRKALAIDATDPKVWNNLAGVLYENLEREAEGIQCIEQALKLDPGNKLGWSNLAVMVGQLGLHDKAMLF